MPNIPGLLMGVATTLAVLATAPHVVLTQGVMKGDDAAITTTTKSPSYHYSHYYYHPDARHAAAAAEDRPPPPKRNIVSNDSVGGGCPRDGAAERALMDACPDISRLIDSGMMMSAVRGDNQTARSVLMKDIEQLMFASPDAITAICRPINCLDAIRASPCIASTNNNGTIALAEAVCGCHAALDAACQASFREAAVLLPMSEVVASFAQSTAVEHHHHHQQPSHHNTSNVVLTDSAVMDDSAVAAVATVDELETTPLGAAVMPASDDALAVEEPSRRHISCVMPLHCRTVLAEAEECATVAPLFLTDTYMAEATHYCCNNSSDGDDTTTDSDDCVDSVVSNGSNSLVAGGRNSSSSASSAVRRRQYYNNNNRDAENEMLAMAMPDSIMALVEVFIDPPRTSLVNGYLPPLARRVDKLREASIYGVGDAVTSPMRDICEWVSRSRDAESGAEGLFWDMLAEPDLITEVCRKVQSNGECLQTAVDVCFGGSTEDFIALVDAALTEVLIAQERYKMYFYNYYYGYTGWAVQDKESIQDIYRQGEGWEIFDFYYYGGSYDWRTDVVSAVETLLNDILNGAIQAYEEYSDNGEGMYGDVQGLLNRVIGPMCTPACESLISSCEAVSALSILFNLDSVLKRPDGRDGMCRAVEAPQLSFGSEKRLVRVEATLSGLATVEDFTDALRSKFRQDMAKAANVPLSLVRIMDVRAGSVVVVTEVLIRADSDGAVEAHVKGFKAAIDDPTGIFESRYFGAVSWTDFGASDPDDESGVDTVFGSAAFGMVVFLAITSLFLAA